MTTNKKISLSLYFFWFLIVTLVTLFFGQAVVLYNNGDFQRAMELSHLGFLGNSEMFSRVDTYQILETFETNFLLYPSVQVIFMRICVSVTTIFNSLFGAPQEFHIFVYGIFQAVLYALALTFFLSQFSFKSKARELIFVLIMSIVLCDIAYVGYFNSFYGEATQHITLIFTVALLIRATKNNTIINGVLFGLSVVCFGLSKFFNIPAAVLLIVLYALIVIRDFKLKKKILFLPCIMAVVILFSFVALVPSWMKATNTYNSIFYGVLRGTDDYHAQKYLSDLGMDEELYVLKDTHNSVSNKQMLDEIYPTKSAESVSYVKILFTYIKNPKRLIEVTPYIAKHAATIRNTFFMDETNMDVVGKMTIWSKIRERACFDTVWLNLIIVFGFAYFLWRKKYHPVFILIVLVGTFYAFYMPFFSNGDADLEKHMYLYGEFIDLFLIFFAADLINKEPVSVKQISVVLAVMLGLLVVPDMVHYKAAETVTLGEYNKKPLEWIVVENKNDETTLILKDNLCNMEFSDESNNYWETSSIRKFLNETIVNECFTDDERENLILQQHKVVVSREHIPIMTEGNRDFYCNPRAELCAAGYDEAYGYWSEDYVCLPNVQTIANMEMGGIKPYLKDTFWLETPYFIRMEMARCVDPDRKVYIKRTNEQLGIRPVIKIKSSFLDKQ